MLRAAVALMFVLALSAGFYVMLAAEFLAGVQVLVYVGGIVVVIVFVIMLTSSVGLLEERPPALRKALGALTALLFVGTSTAAFLYTDFGASSGAHPAESARAIGSALLDYGPHGYVVPFEVISLLLLAAVVGGIAVARKDPPPSQPLTTGGDLEGEVVFTRPRRQDDPEGGSPHA
jgi:NADH-quinone oxidoreductase subunit J